MSARLNTLSVLAALLSLGLLSCPSKPEGPGGTADAGSGDCLDDVDCADPNLFFCNQTTLKCEASCRSKNDCTASVRGQFALDYCAGGLGCQCDEGRCVSSLCSSDADSAGQACRNGQCV